MNPTDLSALYQRFLLLCDAYADNPDVLTGLSLDDVTGQLKQACASQLDAPDLQAALHTLRRVIPQQDMAEFQRLLGKIRASATEYDLP